MANSKAIIISITLFTLLGVLLLTCNFSSELETHFRAHRQALTIPLGQKVNIRQGSLTLGFDGSFTLRSQPPTHSTIVIERAPQSRQQKQENRYQYYLRLPSQNNRCIGQSFHELIVRDCDGNTSWTKWDIELRPNGTFTFHSMEKGIEAQGSLTDGVKVNISAAKDSSERWTKWQAWNLVPV